MIDPNVKEYQIFRALCLLDEAIGALDFIGYDTKSMEVSKDEILSELNKRRKNG